MYAPNATVHASRRTPIHKDKEVGRWKVIENELVSRGLPVTGSRYQGARVGVFGVELKKKIVLESLLELNEDTFAIMI